MRMMCPHCEEFAYTRTSIPMTKTSRETIFQCKNMMCGHVFSAVTEINRTISPSSIPNPKVILPMSRHIERRVLQRQLVQAQISNFDSTAHRRSEAGAKVATAKEGA